MDALAAFGRIDQVSAMICTLPKLPFAILTMQLLAVTFCPFTQRLECWLLSAKQVRQRKLQANNSGGGSAHSSNSKYKNLAKGINVQGLRRKRSSLRS